MISQEQVAVAARAFLETARALHLKQFPSLPCPIPLYDEARDETKAFLTITMRRVLTAAEPENAKRVAERFAQEGVPLY